MNSHTLGWTVCLFGTLVNDKPRLCIHWTSKCEPSASCMPYSLPVGQTNKSYTEFIKFNSLSSNIFLIDLPEFYVNNFVTGIFPSKNVRKNFFYLLEKQTEGPNGHLNTVTQGEN